MGIANGLGRGRPMVDGDDDPERAVCARLDPPVGEVGMASVSERENREIEAANASGDTPVVFIHGLWLLPSSWANWIEFFKQAGYAPLTPDWPDDPETVDEARA